jgi:hypothetical protein
MITANFPGAAEFLAAFDAEICKGGLLVRGATLANAQAGAAVQLTVEVGGLAPVELPATVAAVIPGVGVAVLFAKDALTALADDARNPPLEAEVSPAEVDRPGTLYDRLKAMTVSEKMQLALAGTREERTALLRDVNKTIHVFVLKNPRIGLDEVQGAAKSPNLSPDALKMIAEHKEWSMNAQVCTGLVRNPKTPMPLALKMLERVPVSDLRAIAKGGAREQLVHAARKKVSG